MTGTRRVEFDEARRIKGGASGLPGDGTEAMRKSETGPVRHRKGHTFIEAERTPIPHFYAYRIAASALARGKSTNGSRDDFQIVAVFAAFTAEAYFNYLGPKLLPYWNRIDSIDLASKAEVLHFQVFGRFVDWAKRPYQSLIEVIGYRNGIAHGKIVSVRWRGLVSHKVPFAGPQVKWENCRKKHVAERVLKDVRALATELHTAANQPDDPFKYSGTGHTMLVVPPGGAR